MRIGEDNPWACWECNCAHTSCFFTPEEMREKMGFKPTAPKQARDVLLIDTTGRILQSLEELNGGLQMMTAIMIRQEAIGNRMARALEKMAGIESPEQDDVDRDAELSDVSA